MWGKFEFRYLPQVRWRTHLRSHKRTVESYEPISVLVSGKNQENFKGYLTACDNAGVLIEFDCVDFAQVTGEPSDGLASGDIPYEDSPVSPR